jgi:hypothetical protein
MMLPRCLLHALFLVAGAISVYPQDQRPQIPREKDEDVKLPDGRKQRDAILKADHEKNLRDSQRLVALAAELQADLEKNTQYVFSLEDLKKTEEIEKLIKQIRGRMKRY